MEGFSVPEGDADAEALARMKGIVHRAVREHLLGLVSDAGTVRPRSLRAAAGLDARAAYAGADGSDLGWELPRPAIHSSCSTTRVPGPARSGGSLRFARRCGEALARTARTKAGTGEALGELRREGACAAKRLW